MRVVAAAVEDDNRCEPARDLLVTADVLHQVRVYLRVQAQPFLEQQDGRGYHEGMDFDFHVRFLQEFLT